jgi:hypothetical protein
MSTIDGYYVDMTGKMIEVVATHTRNPRIVDLSEHNLGLAVVDQEFFEDEQDAKEQAKFNIEDTIAQCEERLAEFDKPKRTSRQQSKSSSKSSGGLRIFGRKQDKDPLGPPDYGVSKFVANKKNGAVYEIIGHRGEEEDLLYILNSKNGGMVRLTRDQLDRQYEVQE